ncbi:MAG: GDP-mannose 4,6-dehydratase [Pseudomonadota bacterium]|nr:MAG: GDP-mannose 4,6-dehydratase [Pseudomonadota bacterium]
MSKLKKALITGITGQDGSYLAEILLEKGYEVHGIKRRSSIINTSRIDHLYEEPQNAKKLFLHYGDLADTGSIYGIISKIKPNEIYNLAAQSHVSVSFENPIYTSDVNGLGALRVLEAIRQLDLLDTKFYQASSSELFGSTKSPQSEKSKFYPRSPYAVSKLFAFWAAVNYREAYGIFACNGILFNHESKRRGETFVTRKITMSLSRIFYGLQNTLYLGNLDSKRDWGHAKDYVLMQWLMLQQKNPGDYVISTGKQFTVRYFVETCLKYLDIEIYWKGKGLNEVGIVKKAPLNSEFIKKGQELIKIDKRYFRPSEVEDLLGNSKKAKLELGWTSKISLKEMIKEMMEHDLLKAKSQKIILSEKL